MRCIIYDINDEPDNVELLAGRDELASLDRGDDIVYMIIGDEMSIELTGKQARRLVKKLKKSLRGIDK